MKQVPMNKRATRQRPAGEARASAHAPTPSAPQALRRHSTRTRGVHTHEAANRRSQVEVRDRPAATSLQLARGHSAQTRSQGAASSSGALPAPLRAALEKLSGVELGGVRVHRRSAAPAQLGAHAMARGRDIFLAPGQEHHLPHEAWHVVQQAQGRVRPTSRLGEQALNDDPRLEREADQMGARARGMRSESAMTGSLSSAAHEPQAQAAQRLASGATQQQPVQRVTQLEFDQIMRRYPHLNAQARLDIWGALSKVLARLSPAAAGATIDGYLIDNGLYPHALTQVGDYPFPLGFATRDDFNLFLHKILSSVPAGTVVVVQGSSVSGYSYNDKGVGSRLFDVGRRSDYDVALVSPALYHAAEQLGIKTKGVVGRDEHTVPLTDADLDALGLRRARDAAVAVTEDWDMATGAVAGREVNFMIYRSVEGASQHTGPSLVSNYDKEDYRNSASFMFGNKKF